VAAVAALPGPLRIGLTGGIGSGKSTVAGIAVGLGAALVDTDAIARRLTAAGGAAMPALIGAFGAAIAAADGSLSREAMREQAFADPAAKSRLESILHPLIGAEALAEAEHAATTGSPAIVFDVPLLAESSHWRARVDRILVVDCDTSTQIARVAQRPGWTPDAAARVIAAQATRSARRAIADAVIHNDGITLDQLTSEVQSLWALWVRGV
jgi:dephospho-CoA kinase